MARFFKDRTKATGKAPGSFIFIGSQKMEKPIITFMDYSADNLEEKKLKQLKDCKPYIHKDSVTWVNIYGIHDLQLIEDIADTFGLHHLLVEDMLNTDQMPKYEDADNYDAFIIKMLRYDENIHKIYDEQLTLVLGKTFVLTFQEQVGDVFEPVRERIRKKGRVRLNSNDYLAYVLLDTVVDNYVVLIERLGRIIEKLETSIFNNPDDKIAEIIYTYKTELNYFRKCIRPVKDVMIHLLRSENTYFKPENINYLRDLSELVNHANSAIELYSSMLSDQLNIYNSNVSNRMNQVMKVLTIFASVFIPLTFIAGIYGMNFKYIPELNYRYSYLFFWMGVIIIGGGLFIFFKRKKWL